MAHQPPINSSPPGEPHKNISCTHRWINRGAVGSAILMTLGFMAAMMFPEVEVVALIGVITALVSAVLFIVLILLLPAD